MSVHNSMAHSSHARQAINTRRYYSRAHSLRDDYSFDDKEGWHTVNATSLGYKQEAEEPEKRSAAKAASKLSLGGTVSHAINEVWNGLKGKGSSQTVKITWYTGHDLLNPSCWSDTKWAPTDDSMACALTLEGWTTQPKCFSFLEVCNGPKKCVFVRVVDSCAGCAAGSKHVDLTKGAFSELADESVGILNVQMRIATEPTSWFEDLWGPKSS
ncbi:hypothetical protein SCHPADRAFT_835226 [Schizopora paradoxa]|uniref:RlpA-like protein double-psi beta-barrel domain-containing protein n=1 Tax=Schizopora paradoxa TaxID=27342 RepID=A0A0H2R9K3_9AGAM|nr:hypothetical protein SCHPADRAFT_835226 [Schizopora paradoxa]